MERMELEMDIIIVVALMADGFHEAQKPHVAGQPEIETTHDSRTVVVSVGLEICALRRTGTQGRGPGRRGRGG